MKFQIHAIRRIKNYIQHIIMLRLIFEVFVELQMMFENVFSNYYMAREFAPFLEFSPIEPAITQKPREEPG